nr:MAG TPA: hypothetical protein [Caudoviricetes sp.]
MKSRIKKPSEKPTTAHRKHVKVFLSKASNFLFMTTSKRKSRQLKEKTGGAEERKGLNLEFRKFFDIRIHLLVNCLKPELCNEILRELFEQCLDLFLRLSSLHNAAKIKGHIRLASEHSCYNRFFCVSKRISETDCRAALLQNVVDNICKKLIFFIHG